MRTTTGCSNCSTPSRDGRPMPLADDIRALRDRTLAELRAVHDYLFQS